MNTASNRELVLQIGQARSHTRYFLENNKTECAELFSELVAALDFILQHRAKQYKEQEQNSDDEKELVKA